MIQIAVVGAGIAGLTAAYYLQHGASAPLEVTLYEKSRGVTGRVATRWFDRPTGRVYVDHGTQVLRDESPALHEWLFELLPHHDLSDIGRPVWTFTADNVIHPGDVARAGSPQWSYANGLATLGKRIVEVGALNVRTEVRIGRIVQNSDAESGRFRLFDTDGQLVGEADQVVIAIPAGQAADLIKDSTLPSEEQNSLVAALRQAIYRRCISVTLGFDHREADLSRPYYALLNTDRAHSIVWLAFEQDKPGHVPADGQVIVAQMASKFSAEHWETSSETVIAEVAAMASALLGSDVTKHDWTYIQRWRYSQPDQTISTATVNGVLPGLWFTGDYLVGGRVHLAAQHGKDIAAVIRAAAEAGQ